MSQLSYEMYEERYYRVIRIVLKSLALWPYQRSFFSRIQKILFAIIQITFILVQLLSFTTMQFNRDLLLKIFWSVFPFIFCTTKYCFFVIQADSVKRLLEQIRNDWGLLRSKLEVDIVEKYAHNSKLLTIFVMAACYISVFFLIILQLWPLCLDAILPLNESRPCQLFIMTEYFVNKEKYLYIIVLHEILTLYIGVAALSSIGATFVMFTFHSCALLKVAGNRVENVFEINILTNPRREYLLSQRLADAVIVHRRAIEFSLELHTYFTFNSKSVFPMYICLR